MHWVDIGIAVIVGGAAFFGLTRGLIVEVGGILGAVVGLYLARANYHVALNFLAVFFHRDQHLTAVAFLLVLGIVWALVSMLARGVRGVVRFTPLALVDRLGGGLIGLALGVLTVQVLLVVAVRSHDASLDRSIYASRLAPAFRNTIPGVQSLIPKALPVSP